MKKLLTSFVLILLSSVIYCQNDNFKICLASKSVNKLDSTKFDYVIHEKGTELLLVLRQIDINNGKDLAAIILSNLIIKDKTLKNLPEIPEGKYAFWDKTTNSWEIKKGDLKEIMSLSKNTNEENDCKVIHHGKFKYLNHPDSSAYMIREKDTQTEYCENDKYFSRFKIKWITDCEYKLTFIETNDPKLYFLRKGDTMIVQITNATEKGYDYVSNLNGYTSRGHHIKLK